MDKSIFEPVAAYAAAWTAGDVAAIAALYADDIVLHWGGAHRLSGSHRGKAAALRALAAFREATGREVVAVDDVMAGKARGTIIARERLQTPEGPRVVERVLVYRVADGKLAECWVYDPEQALIDRLIGA